MGFKSLPISLPALACAIDRRPVIVQPETPVLEVISRMSQARGNHCDLPELFCSLDLGLGSETQASATLVVDESGLVGIFTERDLVRLTASRIPLGEVNVAAVMTRAVVTLVQTEQTDLFLALSLLRQHQIRHLPVLDESGQILGIVTPDSIRQALQPFNLLKWRQVEEVMVRQVIHAPATVSVHHLAHLMAHYGVSCVVIVRKEAGELYPIGIVTERDIVQFQTLELNLDQLQAQAVMSAPAFSVSATEPLWLAHQQMQQRRVRRLVVTGDRGELRGILTQTSLLKVFDPIELVGVVQALQQSVEQRTLALQQTNQQLRHEIEERSRAEAQLRQSEAELKASLEQQQHLNQLRSCFVSMASHDLRNPLHSILCNLDLLELAEETHHAEKQSVYRDRIRNAVGEMAGLLNDMLMLGQAEAGRLACQPGPINLLQFCQTLVEEMQVTLGNQCPIHLWQELEQTEAYLDSRLLRQVFTNLLSNAVKYSPLGSPIEFRVYHQAGQWVFEVSDRGIGIPPEDQQRLFESFFRARNVGTIPGTGLGLAIVRHCIEVHGGRVSLASIPNQGTTIRVELPLHVPESTLVELG